MANKTQYVFSWSFWQRADVISRKNGQLAQKYTNSNITDSFSYVLPHSISNKLQNHQAKHILQLEF